MMYRASSGKNSFVLREPVYILGPDGYRHTSPRIESIVLNARISEHSQKIQNGEIRFFTLVQNSDQTDPPFRIDTISIGKPEDLLPKDVCCILYTEDGGVLWAPEADKTGFYKNNRVTGEYVWYNEAPNCISMDLFPIGNSTT